MRRVLLVLTLVMTVIVLDASNSNAFEFKGFADASFSKTTKGADDTRFRNGSFAFGAVDLYFAESFDDVELLSELIVTSTGTMNIERLYLGYVFSDELKIRVGRFHTPLGFWHTSYHHGRHLQPTILRPEAVRFEFDGGIFPAHSIGVWLTGRSRTTAGMIEYGAEVANGPKVVSSRLNPNNTSDNNTGKAAGFHAAISPAQLEGLKVGLSGYFSVVQDDSPVPAMEDIDQDIYAGAVSYAHDKINISGEYFAIGNKAESGSKYNSNAYYGLITYAVNEQWVPYLLYDNVSIKENDPYFIALGTKDATKETIGIRYNISFRSSVKGEARFVERGNSDWNEFALQWALAF